MNTKTITETSTSNFVSSSLRDECDAGLEPEPNNVEGYEGCFYQAEIMIIYYVQNAGTNKLGYP
jgi:hypothetical protein